MADLFSAVLERIVTAKVLRKPLLSKLESYMKTAILEEYPDEMVTTNTKLTNFLIAVVNSSLRNIDRGYISRDVARKAIRTLVANAMIRSNRAKPITDKFKEEHGTDPPAFLLISPTKRCNLKCVGCYATSNNQSTESLPFETIDKMVDESHNKFGNAFSVVSGGEPFLYKDGDKTMFDIWAKYPEMYFLVYTNGTTITPEIAKKLAELGNVTPAISIEGFERETDERRGAGVHKRILEAMKNLREAGVAFGISVTATKTNTDLLLTDEFYDYYFMEQGATYMWQFQLVPIGCVTKEFRGLMVTPEQRVQLYRKWDELTEKKNYPIVDFWNSAVFTNGCIAYGRKGGYMYINWDGNIMPCVFVPYFEDNIKELHNKGKGLTDALFSGFFKRGREWQKKYGYADKKNPDNWLMPCSFRDHYKNFKQNIYTENTKPENPEAEEAIKDSEFEGLMHKFHLELKELTEPIWQKDYVEKEKEIAITGNEEEAIPIVSIAKAVEAATPAKKKKK